MFEIFEGSKDYYGKVIYTDKLLYKHYGIGVGNGRVIHFREDEPFDSCVVETSESEFSGGFPIHRCYRIHPEYSPEEIVSRARSKLYTDFGGYDALNNNCEHFTSWVATGVKTSPQVFFKNDEQDVVEKAIDIIAAPGRKVCEMIDNAVGGTFKFISRLFN